jgi:hypothetical protein
MTLVHARYFAAARETAAKCWLLLIRIVYYAQSKKRPYTEARERERERGREGGREGLCNKDKTRQKQRLGI